MASAPQPPTDLRVLLIGHAGAGCVALAAWLAELPGIVVCNPTGNEEQRLAFVERFRPQVALVDFHDVVSDIALLIARLKGRTPAPAVFVLTHDASFAMRRRCREARADWVFDKTAELDALADVLAAWRVRWG